MILAGEIGLPVVEGKEGFDDLLRAEEVFVTNVLNGVLGVRSVVGHGTFLAPGPRTRELSGLLERHVALSSSRAAGG
jgi:branched-subunit amino acid aminotransferase/4-amino-4-deoxychorismate lyase